MNRILLKKKKEKGRQLKEINAWKKKRMWLYREQVRPFLKLKGDHVLGIVPPDLYAFSCLILS